MTEQSDGLWTVNAHSELLGRDPIKRTYYTIQDLTERFDQIGGDIIPTDLPMTLVEHHFYATNELHRSWEPNHEFERIKPERVQPISIQTTHKIVNRHFNTYCIDVNQELHLISSKKLFSLQLLDGELTPEMFFFLKNYPKKDKHGLGIFSAQNMVYDPIIPVQ